MKFDDKILKIVDSLKMLNFSEVYVYVLRASGPKCNWTLKLYIYICLICIIIAGTCHNKCFDVWYKNLLSMLNLMVY